MIEEHNVKRKIHGWGGGGGGAQKEKLTLGSFFPSKKKKKKKQKFQAIKCGECSSQIDFLSDQDDQNEKTNWFRSTMFHDPVGQSPDMRLVWRSTNRVVKHDVTKPRGPVRLHHSSHHFGWQSSHSVDLAGWQAKMASIEIWIPWRNAHKPHWSFGFDCDGSPRCLSLKNEHCLYGGRSFSSLVMQLVIRI